MAVHGSSVTGKHFSCSYHPDEKAAEPLLAGLQANWAKDVQPVPVLGDET
jgi:hypothetical protein